MRHAPAKIRYYAVLNCDDYTLTSCEIQCTMALLERGRCGQGVSIFWEMKLFSKNGGCKVEMTEMR